MKKKRPLIATLFILLASLACTLTAEPPATLPPRTPLGGVGLNPTISPQAPIVPQATVEAPDGNTGIKPPSTGGDAPALPTSVAAGPSLSSPTMTSQIQAVDQNRLMNTVTTMVSFGNRHTFSVENLTPTRGIGAARDWIMSELYQIQEDSPLPADRIQVSLQEFSFPYNGQANFAQNPTLIINGNQANAGIVIIGAHYDTVNDANPANPDLAQPGANDNGSGVAALLEIARIMSQNPHRATLVFVFFSGEELGRFGSRAYLQDYIQLFGLQDAIRVMINLDTIGSPSHPDGYFDREMRVFSEGPGNSPSRQMARMVEFGARYFLPDIRVNVQDRVDRPNRWGDHQTFSDVGIPAVRLIEQADEFNKFHNAADNLDEIDPVYLRRTTQVALTATLMLADGPLPPQNISLDSSTWRLEWEPVPGADRYVVAMRTNDSQNFQQELVSPTNSFSHSIIQNYDVVVIASVDENGLVGSFSQEFYIANPAVAQQ
jgi:hypothetical protein